MLVTMCAVAVVVKALVPDMPWAAAFTLGAIVAPTDPVAATAIMRRMAVPRRLVSVVEGESLINDGTALVAYRTAVGGRRRARSRSGRRAWSSCSAPWAASRSAWRSAG